MPSYQTTIGGVVSIFVKIIMCIYIAYELYVIIVRKHPSSSEISVLNEFATNPNAGLESIEPWEEGFDIALNF